jgi:hypothetical protein
MKKMDYKHHIFLSYAHKDVDIMIPIRNYLESKEFKVWTDENLKPGTPEWVRAIENALDECGCMIVIFTTNAQMSKWVQREITYADRNEIQIIPLVVSGEPEKSLIVNSTQYIDAQDFDSAARKLVATVRDYLNLPIVQPEAEYQIVIPGEDIFPTDTLKKYNDLGDPAKQVLKYISDYKAKYDRAASVRDIQDNLNISSTSMVNYYVKELKAAGFLNQDEKLARGTFIVKPFPRNEVFLSYSLADEELALQIEQILVSKEVRVCKVEREGPTFTRLARLQDEIRNSVCMVSMLSPYAKHSIKVLSHLICAQETQTPIIPLLLSGNPIDAIPTTLPTRYYDMRDISDSRLDQFGDLLVHYIGRLI